MNYKEYSRLRSIAQKRIERASQAGLMDYVYIPTVKEIKASANPSYYIQQVKSLIETGATVRALKAETVKVPEVRFIPTPPIPKAIPDEARKARKREQSRRSKAKRAIEKSAGSAEKAKRQVGYLKALETVARKWREAGIDIGNWLGVMSPGMSKKFVDYMEYRFSQGDYNNRYTIDTFIKDFGTLVKKGYDFKDIQTDFGWFLNNQKQLSKNREHTNKYGISVDDVSSAWREMASRGGRK